MNRVSLDSIASSRRASVGSQPPHIRGGGGNRVTVGADAAEDSLDLFARTRRSDGGAALISTNNIRSVDVSTRLEKLSIGLTRMGKGMEDLFDAEIGKHDYDWLLAPPETPLYPSTLAMESPLSAVSRESPLSSGARESPISTAVPRGRIKVRSVSNKRSSRLSASQTENGPSGRPVRSSSVTRSSISNTCSSSSFSNNNRASTLNTSSASITSSTPSTSGNRSATCRPAANPTTARPSSSSTSTFGRPSSSTLNVSRPSSLSSTASRPSSTVRSVLSRVPTPTRTRPNPSSSSGDRTTLCSSTNSRPCTPTSSRPQTPSNPNINSCASSRSSTPTRRPPSSAGRSSSSASNVGGRLPSAVNNQRRNPWSRGSSPGPRLRAPVSPIDLPDFPADAPPNLRTKLPDRPASAGRARPGMALTVRANSGSVAAAVPAVTAHLPSSNRRNYMPLISGGRFPELTPSAATGKLQGNNGKQQAAGAAAATAADMQKMVVSDGGLRRLSKPASATESTGFGRTISKNSLDVALRHMDIRQGMGGIRASSLFPQSIRSVATRSGSKSDLKVPLAIDEAASDNGNCNGTIAPYCRSSFAPSENGVITAAAESTSPDRDSFAARDNELDLNGSSRYDNFMLKEEDSKNMNWLHSVEDKSDHSPVFDHRFEPLPEPFGTL